MIYLDFRSNKPLFDIGILSPRVYISPALNRITSDNSDAFDKSHASRQETGFS